MPFSETMHGNTHLCSIFLFICILVTSHSSLAHTISFSIRRIVNSSDNLCAHTTIHVGVTCVVYMCVCKCVSLKQKLYSPWHFQWCVFAANVNPIRHTFTWVIFRFALATSIIGIDFLKTKKSVKSYKMCVNTV